jgi:hypothetical protein
MENQQLKDRSFITVKVGGVHAPRHGDVWRSGVIERSFLTSAIRQLQAPTDLPLGGKEPWLTTG